MGQREDEVRVSHAEREAALAILHQQLSEGRLAPEEYLQRSEGVATAVTRRDVRQLITNAQIGHEERADAQASLSEHFAAGRLTADEFLARTTAISFATTGDDLTPVFADLLNYSHDDRVRISALERDEALALLRRHFTEGQLSPDEFSTRTADVSAAVNRADLRPMFADLSDRPPLSGGVTS